MSHTVTCHAASAGSMLLVIVAGLLLGIIHLAVRFRDYFPAPSEYQTGAGSEGCESCGGVNRNIMGGTSVSFCPLLLLLLAII